uniref:Amino acid transporter n=1 Tax=Acrobeloides nanus TaxID=290746 RepID=A0A914DJI8_9BILA
MHTTDENKIGVFEAISYCVGDIIGSGIFVSPSSILKHTGSVGLSLCTWAIGAVISMIGAFVYIELGTSIRKSGCDFAYLTHARWYPLATAFLFVSVTLTYPSILAIQTMTFGEYVVNGLEKLTDLDDVWKKRLQRLLGYSVLWILVFINFFSLKNFANSTKEVNEIVLGLYGGLFAYNGWDILNFGTEEVVNPRRTLPIAALCGIGISAVVYIAINMAYFGVLTIEEFKSSDTVAVIFAERTLGNFSYVIPFLIALLLLGNLNTTIFGTSRYLHAGACNNRMPTVFKCVHPLSNSPRAAIIVEMLIAIGLSFLGDLDHLVNYMTYALWMQRTIVQIALIYMRFKHFPFPKDRFRNPIFVPMLFFLICIALLVIPVKNDYNVAIFAVPAVLIGLLIWLVFIYPTKLPKFLHIINEKVVIVGQIIFNIVPVPDSTDEVNNVSLPDNNEIVKNGKKE